MDSDEHQRVLDPEHDTAALKALTHPLRIQLLGLLRQDGPATASELAARTGESSASASYHLRVLAKYAFIAEAEHRDGRERRWRALHTVTSWSNETMESTAAGRAFVSLARRRQIDHLERSLARHEADMAAGRLGEEWVEASGISDLMPRLTAESLSELFGTVAAKLEELTARDADDPRAERVVVLAAGLPLAPHEPAGPAPADSVPEASAPAGSALPDPAPEDPAPEDSVSEAPVQGAPCPADPDPLDGVPDGPPREGIDPADLNP
ncbi:DNA-binding transcriptional ArsR family regulator [Streptomyces luteogriseus]|uniref:DNA-binding transcriptional ArsR family regulator n=1 Tax=Streptomyces luteogriseus TaxID=68233 RepID=A0A7W7GJ95_9ACTN|nr:DNA-binding transcriptional ArsR family regulator [Streptomyces luteogriseus]